jgi:hypothetical protein
VRLITRRERTWPDGRVTPAHESYPPESSWGWAAWSEPTLVHARSRWDGLRGTPGGPAVDWSTLGILDDPEGYTAWKAGRLPRLRPSDARRPISTGGRDGPGSSIAEESP